MITMVTASGCDSCIHVNVEGWADPQLQENE